MVRASKVAGFLVFVPLQSTHGLRVVKLANRQENRVDFQIMVTHPEGWFEHEAAGSEISNLKFQI